MRFNYKGAVILLNAPLIEHKAEGRSPFAVVEHKEEWRSLSSVVISFNLKILPSIFVSYRINLLLFMCLKQLFNITVAVASSDKLIS
ncbi:hypothetical protein ABEP44_12745, partial [Cutibacterium acnes]